MDYVFVREAKRIVYMFFIVTLVVSQSCIANVSSTSASLAYAQHGYKSNKQAVCIGALGMLVQNFVMST